jgi:hypothetical protein
MSCRKKRFMGDDAVVWTLAGILLLIAICLAVIATIVVGGWYITCPHTSTTCDCNGDYPQQCNYQCYHASKCTCDDLDDLKSVRDSINSWVSKKSAQATGGTPQSGSMDWTEGGKVAGLTDSGEFWIDKEYQKKHCQSLADSLYVHEMIHKNDDTCRNPASFAWQVIRSMFNKNYKTEQLDQSEFSAYGSQQSFLNDKIAELQATCSYQYKCSYSGKMFKDVQECIVNCPCSLAHPCAMVKPHCIEINTETGEETGMRY